MITTIEQENRRKQLNNNELLFNIVQTLDISTEQMKEILEFAEIKDQEVVDHILEECDNETFEGFLNGFIVFKRGKEEPKPGARKKAPLPIKVKKSINNVILKKLKIAFSLTNEDIVELFESEGVSMTKNELTTYFRKEGHKHYRRLEDYYLKNFLNGVAKR